MITAEELMQANQILKDEWFCSFREDNIDFIYDGATNPAEWIKSPWRIMCLLQEAQGGGHWNHAEAINSDNGLLRVGGTANQSVPNRMVEWLYAIESTLEGVPIDVETDREQDHCEARKTMLRSAWVNIKKVNGLPYSDNNNLYKSIKEGYC